MPTTPRFKTAKPFSDDERARMQAVVDAARMLRKAHDRWDVKAAQIAQSTLANALDTLDGKRRA